eukprot:TRINITY_DN1731_c1_g1_i2.p1 TRINITY_DN1731_c1_g1~~TRINITY_DN1731_c1_g1_i2.p1  ORF type:complete len:260 (+),score=42.95 TRINITY_DN1731_c1_g1_i2:126-905(+)
MTKMQYAAKITASKRPSSISSTDSVAQDTTDGWNVTMKASVKALLEAIPQLLTSVSLPFVVKTGVTVEDFEAANQDRMTVASKLWWEFENGTVTIYEYGGRIHDIGAMNLYSDMARSLPELVAGVSGIERIVGQGMTAVLIADAGFYAQRPRPRVPGSNPLGPDGLDGTENWDAVKMEFAYSETEDHADTKAQDKWLSHGTTVQAVICVKAFKQSRTITVKLLVRTTAATIIMFHVPVAQVFGKRTFLAGLIVRNSGVV